MVVTCPRCGSKNRVPAARLNQAAKCGQCKSALSPMAAPHAVRSTEEFDEITANSPLPVLVDFWAAWCGPCRMVAPELDKLARERAGRLVIVKVDTEALPEVAGRYGIRSIPTLMLFKGGQLAKQQAGAMSAPQIVQAFGL